MSDKGFETLFVPATARRALAFSPPQSTPQSINELPSRLPMGDLQPDTFKKTTEGFEVYYRSGDFSMKMDVKGDSMYAEERYKDTELLYYIGVCKRFLGPRMTLLRIGPTEEADKRIGSDLAQIGNIKYVPFGNVMETGTANFFPDGFLMSIVIPLAIDGSVFQRLSRFIRNVPNENSISLSGFMDFSQHVVNYRIGYCNDIPDDPMLLYEWSLERGFLPISMPELEGRPDNPAITLRRMGYNLVLNVFMRDLFQVIHLLRDAGLIGDNQGVNQEEATIVIDTYKLKSVENLSFYTEDKSRRVFFPGLMSNDVDMRTPPLGHDEFDQALKTTLTKYQSIITDFKAAFDRALSEATKSSIIGTNCTSLGSVRAA